MISLFSSPVYDVFLLVASIVIWKVFVFPESLNPQEAFFIKHVSLFVRILFAFTHSMLAFYIIIVDRSVITGNILYAYTALMLLWGVLVLVGLYKRIHYGEKSLRYTEENRRIIEKLIAERRYDEVPIFLKYLKFECGGEEKYVKKIERLESYLSDGLPRYQDILEERNMEMPEAPEGIEYKNPGIMESQIFTVLSKRFKSGRLSFSKIGATCLAKICASKVENKGIIELEKLEQPIEIDDSIEQYMLEIENNLESVTNVFRANEKINSDHTCKQVTLNSNNPILQAIKMVSISDLNYIYNFY